MDNMTQATKSEGRLQPCLSPAAAWAPAVGTSVGRGSLVVTGNPHIIGIADDLNVPVAAEGVETEEQYLALKKLGCAYVQGYYFSRPVPTEEFDRFLAQRSENR